MSDYDLDQHADIYIVNFASQHRSRRTLFRMTIGDAMKVCECRETQGVGNYGGQWMLCWTRNGLTDLVADEFEYDDGRFNSLFDRIGVTVLASKDLLKSGEAFQRLAARGWAKEDRVALHELHAGGAISRRPHSKNVAVMSQMSFLEAASCAPS